jgi:hypothetical protein
LIETVDLQKAKDGEQKMRVLVNQNYEKTKAIYGLTNGAGSCVYEETEEVLNGYNYFNYKTDSKCFGLEKPFVFLLDEQGNILDGFNVKDQKPEYFAPHKELELVTTDKNQEKSEIEKYIQYLLYIAVGFLILGLILFFVNRTAGIAFVVVGILLVLGFFGYQKMFATPQVVNLDITETNTQIRYKYNTEYNYDDPKILTTISFFDKTKKEYAKPENIRAEVRLKEDNVKEINYSHKDAVYDLN